MPFKVIVDVKKVFNELLTGFRVAAIAKHFIKKKSFCVKCDSAFHCPGLETATGAWRCDTECFHSPGTDCWCALWQK